jgi:hypothetical protein
LRNILSVFTLAKGLCSWLSAALRFPKFFFEDAIDMKLATGIILTVLSAAGLSAQSYGISNSERIVASIEERFAARDRERLEADTFEEKRFVRRASDFVTKWNAFVERYNQGHLDTRAARELSQAFRKMEKAGCWPKPEPLKNSSTRFSARTE